MNRLVLELKKLGFFSFIKENIEFHVDAMGLKRSSTSKATLALGEHFDTEEMSVHGANENDEGESKPLPVDDKSAPQEHGNPAEEDLVVVGDAGKLRGILIFLLSNVSSPFTIFFPVAHVNLLLGIQIYSTRPSDLHSSPGG